MLRFMLRFMCGAWRFEELALEILEILFKLKGNFMLNYNYSISKSKIPFKVWCNFFVRFHDCVPELCASFVSLRSLRSDVMVPYCLTYMVAYNSTHLL